MLGIYTSYRTCIYLFQKLEQCSVEGVILVHSSRMGRLFLFSITNFALNIEVPEHSNCRLIKLLVIIGHACIFYTSTV